MIIFWAAGAFAVLLGLLHFTFATRFHYMKALPLQGPDVPPFKLWFYQYPTKRSDLRGIIYVMNHCTSYTIVMAGIFDLCYQLWEGTLAGAFAALAVGGFWLVRAISQTYLGRRPGDWYVMALFTGLFLLHVMPITLVAVTAYSVGLNH
jgi:hypothetical protein